MSQIWIKLKLQPLKLPQMVIGFRNIERFITVHKNCIKSCIYVGCCTYGPTFDSFKPYHQLTVNHLMRFINMKGSSILFPFPFPFNRMFLFLLFNNCYLFFYTSPYCFAEKYLVILYFITHTCRHKGSNFH